MNHDSLDERGHNAARAARAAVVPVEAKVSGAIAQGSWDPGARLRHRRTRSLVGALVVVALLVTAGAAVIADNRGGRGTNVATGPARQNTAPGDSAVRDSAFCRKAPKPGAETPESYVGSPQHGVSLEDLIAVAPPAVRQDLVRFRAYVKANVNPARPESQLTENWPPEIRSAADRIQRFIQDNCGPDPASPCVRHGDAEVCGRRKGSAVVFEASGLQPGSTLEMVTTEAGPLRVPIGPDGRPAAGAGSLGLSFPARVQFVARTQAGDDLRGILLIK